MPTALRDKIQGAFEEEVVAEDEKNDNERGLSFWEKYIEIQVPILCLHPQLLFTVVPLSHFFPHQVHMVTAHGNLGEHQFGAAPQNWPLMGKTLPYWLDEGSNVRMSIS